MLDIAIVTDEIALDIRTAIAEGKKLGIRKYELRCIGSYEKRVPYIDQADYGFIKEQVASGVLQITALSPGTFKVTPSETKVIERGLQETLPATFIMAKELGAPLIIIFSFTRDDTPEAKVLGYYEQIAHMAAEHGLAVAIENEPGFYCDSGVTTARILQQLNIANLGVNWDPANAIGTGELPYPVGYDAVKPFIRNVHVKDAIMDARQGCKLFGDGGVNWSGQISALLKDQIVPHITLETHYNPLLESTQLCYKRIKATMQMVAQEWEL
jgi:sugar phosphate isomerase/epimerase